MSEHPWEFFATPRTRPLHEWMAREMPTAVLTDAWGYPLADPDCVPIPQPRLTHRALLPKRVPQAVPGPGQKPPRANLPPDPYSPADKYDVAGRILNHLLER